MRYDRSFRFADGELNRLLQVRVEQAHIRHRIDGRGAIRYSSADEEQFEDVLAILRTQTFASWKILSCPTDAVDQYRRAMMRRAVKYREEINNGMVEFLIPRACRPHAWKLDDARN